MFVPALLLILQQSTATPPAPLQEPLQEPLRRRPVTEALRTSAFADSATRELVMFARRARNTQDSSLRGYDAKTQTRLTVSARTSPITPNKLLFRTENIANVKWRRDQGMWIEPIASRNTVPTQRSAMVSGVYTSLIAVPYYPGRDQLWVPVAGLPVVKKDVDESEGFVHPLAEGSEAYYKFRIGDTIRITLPSKEVLTLRELKVTARKPEWRSFVGSFWFDLGSGSLVRAAYRLSAPIDIWNEALGEAQKDLAEAERDTTDARDKRIAEAKSVTPPAVVGGIINPMRFDITLVTIEYALYERRYWLPYRHRAEGNSQIAFMRLPMQMEESYTYDDVVGTTPLPPLPSVESAKLTSGSLQVCAPACIDVEGENDEEPVVRARRRQIIDSLLRSNGLEPALIADTSARATRVRLVGDSLYRVFRDSVQTFARAQRYAARDSLLRVTGRVVPAASDSSRSARRLRSIGDSLYRTSLNTERRKVRDAECAANGGFYTRTDTRHEGALRYGVRLPCDSTALASSKELPSSPYDENKVAFPTQHSDELADMLDLSLQPAFGPQPLQFDYALGRQRYNRVEGLSLGAQAKRPLGAGYTAFGEMRFGLADLQPNGEVRLERSNGRKTVSIAAFRRLSATNDFGDPLSFGASLATFLYGRDEGFYYRNAGAELVWSRQTSTGQLRWRVFGERHDPAQRESNFNLGNAFSRNRSMQENITAEQGQIGGVAGEWHAGYGLDPNGWTLATDVRAEGAGGSFNYARALFDVTVARPLFWKFAFGQTASMGIATDSVPLQRQFYMGGLRTVRGQQAGTQIGSMYWLSRSELGVGSALVRPSVFFDVGWAGERRNFSTPGRPQAGWGIGASVLGGLIRADVARGMYPRRGTRVDLSLGARF